MRNSVQTERDTRGMVRGGYAVLAGAVLLAAAGLTLLLISRNLWYVFRSVTNVPYADQWVLLQEVARKRAGQLDWSYLWSPYWGQRPLLPRLATLLSIRYSHFSVLPFNLASLAALIGMTAVILLLIRRLFPIRSWFFWIAAIAAVRLLFSTLHIEVVIVSMAMNFTFGYGSAIAAIAILAMARENRSGFEHRFWLAVFLGLVSTACLAVGLLVWPMLFFQLWVLRARPRHYAVLGAITAAILIFYSIGYVRPEMGMGVGGVIVHPIQAVRITAMVLGGPLSDRSRTLGTIAGIIGLTVAGWSMLSLRHARALAGAAVALRLTVCFIVGTAASLVAGRISPEWLIVYSGAIVPSRYLLPILAFWAALVPVSLSCWREGLLARASAITITVIVAVLTFGMWNWEWRFSREWAAFSERYDAIASGFLLDVSDAESMSPIIINDQIRRDVVDFMRREHLSVFAEPRAGWIGKPLSAVGAPNPQANCGVAIDAAVPLTESAGFRVTGGVTADRKYLRQRLDLVFADQAGTIEGLARTLPIYSESGSGSAFLGYTRTNPGPDVRVYVRLPDGRVCGASPLADRNVR